MRTNQRQTLLWRVRNLKRLNAPNRPSTPVPPSHPPPKIHHGACAPEPGARVLITEGQGVHLGDWKTLERVVYKNPAGLDSLLETISSI